MSRSSPINTKCLDRYALTATLVFGAICFASRFALGNDVSSQALLRGTIDPIGLEFVEREDAISSGDHHAEIIDHNAFGQKASDYKTKPKSDLFSAISVGGFMNGGAVAFSYPPSPDALSLSYNSLFADKIRRSRMLCPPPAVGHDSCRKMDLGNSLTIFLHRTGYFYLGTWGGLTFHVRPQSRVVLSISGFNSGHRGRRRNFNFALSMLVGLPAR